jgi:lipopolysaccharide biosynthesis protein
MNKIKPIAFYLPQYHAIPENDEWWGEGFTEWTNVKKAQPLFEGHYQPHVPHESLGYYDLRDPEVLVKQAAMAKEYGIYGFCFYHYWFGGKKLLQTPVENYLNSGKSDFPYCLCWANENWTRRWDGLENEILLAQKHSDQDDLDFIIDKIPYFKDIRYIRINDKPVLLVYKTELLPDAKKTAELWRTAMRENGIGEIYLIRVENTVANLNPDDIGFDGAVEFAPDWRLPGFSHFPETYNKPESLNVYDYLDTAFRALSKDLPDYKIFRGVFPNWDNTARRGSSAFCFLNNDPSIFEFYLQQIVNYTRTHYEPDEQFVFINAWNEWGEGCHLEPDEKNQFSYLEICRKVLNSYESNPILERLLYLYKTQIQTDKQLKLLTRKIDSVIDYKPYKLVKALLEPFAATWRLFKKH